MSWVKFAVIGVVAAGAVGAGIYFTVKNLSGSENKNVVENIEEVARQEYNGIQHLDAESIEFWENSIIDLSKDGHQITFSVYENLTTGYSWSIDPNGCDPSIVSIEQTYDAPATFEDEEPMMGVGGQAYFTITSQENSGDCTFRIAYARPWMFNWENFTGDEENSNYDQLIEIPVSVF